MGGVIPPPIFFMMEVQPNPNTSVQTADKIQNIIYNVAMESVIQSLKTEFIFLRLLFISQIFDFFINRITGLLYEQMKTFVTFSIIDSQIGVQRDSYEKAVDELKKAYAQGDSNAIEKANQEFKNKLRDLIRMHTN